MGIFSKRIDEKNATKTTYSEDDLKKLELNYIREYSVKSERRIYTPFKKEIPRALLTQIRDQIFESILDKHLYTFKHLLVIPNPYGVVIQTALLLFNTSRVCKVRYRVLGVTPEADFTGETRPDTRHRVPILGLYKGKTNKLQLELIDEQGQVFKRRDLTIYAREIPLSMQNLVTNKVHKESSQFPFILVNGLRFNPIVLDQNGDVRYALQLKTNKLGMIPLQNGHFLYADTSANRVGEEGCAEACQYHEIDYMGRIYHTYLLEYPVRRAIAQNEDSLFLVTSSGKEYEGDCIIQLDRKSGNIIKQCNLADIIGTTYRDRKSWTPITYMEYNQGMLLLSLKRFHTIMQLRWEDLSVMWMLAPQAVWKGTSLESCLLSPDGEEAGSFLHPEYVSRIENKEQSGKEKVLICSIQNKGTIPVPEVKGSDTSKAAVCEIDTETMKYRCLEQVETEKTIHFFKAIQGENRLLLLSGFLRDENRKSMITEVDSATGKLCNRIQLCRAYGNAWTFAPDIESYGDPLEKNTQVIYGQLTPPEVFTGELPPMSEEKLLKRYFNHIRVCSDMLLFDLFPGMISRVYLSGEKNVYMQDFSRLEEKRRRQTFAISLGQLDYDEYQVLVEYEGNVYQLKNEIRIEKKKNDKQS